jgi:hypothetical protein
VNGRNLCNISVGITEPDDKFGEVCWSCFQHIQVALPKKTVILQQTRAICLHRGWSAIGRRFPIEKCFHFWDEIALVINQVIYPALLWYISGDYPGSFARMSHITTSTIHTLFVVSPKLFPLKNMIRTTPNLSKRIRWLSAEISVPACLDE